MTLTTRIALVTIAFGAYAQPLTAQFSLEGLVRTDRYWGGSAGFDDSGSPLSFRPFRPQFLGARAGYSSGRVRLSAGIGVSHPSLGAEGGDGNAITIGGETQQVEADMEIALRLLKAGEHARVWAYAAPMLNRWTFVDTRKTTIGVALGLETEVDLSRHISAVTRISLGVQAPPLAESVLPEGYSAKTLWRRSIGIGLRYKL